MHGQVTAAPLPYLRTMGSPRDQQAFEHIQLDFPYSFNTLYRDLINGLKRGWATVFGEMKQDVFWDMVHALYSMRGGGPEGMCLKSSIAVLL